MSRWQGGRSATWRRYKYGISYEEFLALQECQDHKCAICRKDLLPGKGTCVDHDHKTKKVRGLLCWGCNIGIGHLKDDPELLKKAILYLEAN